MLVLKILSGLILAIWATMAVTFPAALGLFGKKYEKFVDYKEASDTWLSCFFAASVVAFFAFAYLILSLAADCN